MKERSEGCPRPHEPPISVVRGNRSGEMAECRTNVARRASNGGCSGAAHVGRHHLAFQKVSSRVACDMANELQPPVFTTRVCQVRPPFLTRPPLYGRHSPTTIQPPCSVTRSNAGSQHVGPAWHFAPAIRKCVAPERLRPASRPANCGEHSTPMKMRQFPPPAPRILSCAPAKLAEFAAGGCHAVTARWQMPSSA